jgi:hypothetical protein
MITQGTNVWFRPVNAEPRQVLIGAFSIEITESGMREALISITDQGHTKKEPLWMILDMLRSGHMYLEPQTGKLLEKHRRVVETFMEITGLSFEEALVACENSDWNVPRAIRKLFDTLRNRTCMV